MMASFYPDHGVHLRLALVVLLTMLGGPLLADTGCRYPQLPGPSSINFGSVEVPRDAPAGTVVAEVDSLLSLECNDGIWDTMNSIRFSTHTLASGDPNFEFRLRFRENNDREVLNRMGDGRWVSLSLPMVYQLVKTTNTPLNMNGVVVSRTGNLAGEWWISGCNNYSALTEWTLFNSCNYINRSSRTTFSRTLQATLFSRACEPSVASKTVQLPETATTDFAGSGVAGSTAFELDYQCDTSGAPGIQDVKMRLQGNTVAGDIRTLSNQASVNPASNVGIQVLYQNAPVALDGSQVIELAPTEALRIPLQARYRQLGDTPGAGRVEASATVIMSYQ